MPAINVDLLENIYLSFARSSPAEFGSLYQTGHRIGVGVAEAPQLVKSGVQCLDDSGDVSARYGDYFGAAVDPVGFRRVWAFGQWASNEACCTAVWDWGTWVARLQFGTITTAGRYNTPSSFFHLRNSNSTGVADLTFQFGPPGAGWTELSGDWDGDGIETIGLYNPATGIFYLR